VARRKPARSVTTLAPQVLSGASALALQRQRRGKTWGNKGPDADSDAERLLERRLAYLTTTRVLTGWERNRTSYDLLGVHGTVVGTYTFDYIAYVRGLPGAPEMRAYALETKGRVTRDFPLRRNLFRDSWCVHHDFKWPEATFERLDVIPVLSREQRRALGMDYYVLVDRWHPTEWPKVEQDFAASLRKMTAQKASWTRAANKLARTTGP
jgi:hypothetical protein